MASLKAVFDWIYTALTAVVGFIASVPGAIVTLVASFVTVVSNLVSWLSSNLQDGSYLSNALESVNSFKGIDFGSQGIQVFDILSWMGSLDIAFDIFASLGVLFCGLWSVFIFSTLLAILAITVSTVTFRLTCKGINLVCPFIHV